jgi:hypothetical protein
MLVNYWAILVCAVLSMVIGSVWYGPLFGKLWMRICGTREMSDAECNEMKKKAIPLYFVQFLLSLLQLFILAYLTGSTAMNGMVSAIIVWVGFVMPTLAGACMWTSEARKMAWSRFLVQAGYHLVSLSVFGLILGGWH